MQHIGSHLSATGKKRGKETERGEMLKYFQTELNRARVRDGLPLISMPRMGKILELIPTKDLYYLRSVCDDTAKRGGEFSKKFWWEIKPRKDGDKQPPIFTNVKKTAR